MELRYLFTAYLSDGSTIVQTPEDTSTAEPLTRSAFYDVQQRLDEVEYFELKSVDEFYPDFTVDLRNGRFKMGSLSFRAEPTTNHIAMRPGGTYTLVYYRDHTHTFGEEDQHVYRLGWTYISPDGQRFEQTIVIP